MPNPDETPQVYELRLVTLIAAMWRRRWVVLCVIALFAGLGLAYSLTARKWYQADVVLMLSENTGASVATSQLGNLASVAGISLARTGSSQLPLAALKSRELIQEFIQDEGLLKVVLFDSWDERTKQWTRLSGGSEPDIRDAVELFERDVRRISEDKSGGVVTLSISWTDPLVAANWANNIVVRLNEKLRARAMQEADSNIKYLRTEIANVPIAQLQQSMGRVLESEMQKLMLAKGSPEYAFKVVDRAVAPKKPSKPQPVLVVLASIIFGLIICVAFVLLFDVGLKSASRRK